MKRHHHLILTGTILAVLAGSLILGSCGIQVNTSGTKDSTSGTKDSTSTNTATPETSTSPAVTPSPSPSPSPLPSPKPSPSPMPTPLLPRDDKTESFFGPLPVPSANTPLQHNVIKGLYIGAGGNLADNLAVARQTEINGLVIDLKESDGIYFNCSVPLAIEIGAVKNIYDLKAIVEQCHEAGVKVIGRIVCFKDKYLTAAKPEYCISDASGKKLSFYNEGGQAFISPYNQDAWQYNIDIALDAIALGVDEIQFDYVRFPTGGTKSGAKPYFGPPDTVPDRIQVINRFLQTAAIRIQVEKGIPLGADVFAIIMTNTSDSVSLGQEWATAGLTGIDSISPMIYPSHYANSSTGHYSGNGKGTYINGVLYPKPDLEPYNVMYNVLLAGRDSVRQSGNAACRPWLQAFTASYLPEGYYQEYGSEQIKDQIKAIYDAGFDEYICWDPQATYSKSAFAAEN